MSKNRRRANAKGRNTHEAHIRLHRGVTQSPAWKSLDCTARALLIDIWCKHNGYNNGEIAYGIREARTSLRIGTKKAMQAFKALEERGFLVCRFKGSFNNKQPKASEWELTTEPLNKETPARRLYKGWAPQ